MKSPLKLSISLLSLSLPALAFAAQTGGTYVPPQGADFSKITINVQVACNADNSFANIVGVGSPNFSSTALSDGPGTSTFGNISGSNGTLFLLAGKMTEADADEKLKSQVIAPNLIQVRNSIDGPWLNFGQISLTDLANTCLTQYKNAEVPLTLLPGVQVSFTRSIGMSMCWSLPDNYTRSRVLTYNVSVSNSDGSNQNFTVEQEVSYVDKPSCQNWQEAPWVSQ